MKCATLCTSDVVVLQRSDDDGTAQINAVFTTARRYVVVTTGNQSRRSESNTHTHTRSLLVKCQQAADGRHPSCHTFVHLQSEGHSSDASLVNRVDGLFKAASLGLDR